MRITFLFSLLILFVWTRPTKADDAVIRVATFNVSLNRTRPGELGSDLKRGDKQAENVAAILRKIRPDIVLLNEFDYDSSDEALRIFRERYLNAAGDDALPLPHSFTAPVNTGLLSGLDLNGDGTLSLPQDAFGFGRFPGQYGMAVLSRYPIDAAAAQTFQRLLWRDMPSPSRPVDPKTGESWYPNPVWDQLRLSSKSHWVVPVDVKGRRLNLVACHPTPPAFDGPEDRNGCRNHDEIELIRYIISGQRPPWLITDTGVQGGLAADDAFVICGDLNSDPHDGGSRNSAIRRLLHHSRVRTVHPASGGAVEAAWTQKGVNQKQRGEAKFDTADFSDERVGNLRVDYCLPSVEFHVVDSGVYWPDSSDENSEKLNCSDHRLVWVDLQFID